MEQYELIERAILNCFITKPELMKETLLKEVHFKKHRKLFIFLKEFYERFGTFDIALMGSVCKNPSEALDYIAEIIDTTSVSGHFKEYEKRLLLLYYDYDIIEEIHNVETQLYYRKITLGEFKKKMTKILEGVANE